jgi:MFS family permease
VSSTALGLQDSVPHTRRNFALNVLDGAVFAFGMSLASRTTVLPLFVQKLGGSNVAIGMIPVLWMIGFNLPQLFIANHARQVRSKKRLVLQTGLFQRIPWLLLAVLTLVFLWRLPPGWGLAVFFLLYGLAAFGGSLNLPGWFDLVAKLTPVRMRGRLFAWRAVLGGLLGIGAGAVVTRVLGGVAEFENFALLFGMAFAATMISYLLLVAIREEVPSQPPRKVHYGAFLRELPHILRHDRNYRNFVIGDALIITALMSEAFFAIYALQRFGLDAGYVGVFIMVLTASAAAGSLLFGYLADRVGHRINLAVGAGATLLACLAALYAPSPGVFLAVFVCSSFAIGLPMISRLPIIAELCVEEDRATYIALTNAITAPFWLSGLMAGFIADRFGFDVLFGLTAIVALAAMIWMLTMVPEPRNGPAPVRLPAGGGSHPNTR